MTPPIEVREPTKVEAGYWADLQYSEGSVIRMGVTAKQKEISLGLGLVYAEESYGIGTFLQVQPDQSKLTGRVEMDYLFSQEIALGASLSMDVENQLLAPTLGWRWNDTKSSVVFGVRLNGPQK